MKIVFGIVSALAWCGVAYGYVLFLKQLRASNCSIWTLNYRARFNAWRGRPIAIFLICGAIFAGAIWASIEFR
jgi:amino acid permease